MYLTADMPKEILASWHFLHVSIVTYVYIDVSTACFFNTYGKCQRKHLRSNLASFMLKQLIKCMYIKNSLSTMPWNNRYIYFFVLSASSGAKITRGFEIINVQKIKQFLFSET